MAEERFLDVREIATLVTTLYADRLPASSSSSGVPAQRTSTGVSESSEEHGVVLIRDSSLKSDEAWTERGCSFGSGASGSTSAVPRCGTDGSLGLGGGLLIIYVREIQMGSEPASKTVEFQKKHFK